MKKLTFFILAIIGLFHLSCTDSEESTRRIQIRMTDAPGDYDAVNIDIQGIQYHISDGNQEAGWVELENVNAGIYNLLDFTNGIDTTLTDTDLPSGKISQIRLLLGQNNSIELDGETYNLKTPSAQTSGLKLNLHESLLEGITYKVLLDFDAARSVVQNGKDFSLKPVIKVVSEAQNGAITGNVYPVEAAPAIYAILGDDTTATYADSTGYFLIGNLNEGSYTLSFDADELFEDLIIEQVEVKVGERTELGRIEF